VYTQGQLVKVNGAQYIVEAYQTFEGTPLAEAEMRSRGVVAMLALRKPRGTKVTFHRVMQDSTICTAFA
jgi:hypothetical protein